MNTNLNTNQKNDLIRRMNRLQKTAGDMAAEVRSNDESNFKGEDLFHDAEETLARIRALMEKAGVVSQRSIPPRYLNR